MKYFPILCILILLWGCEAPVVPPLCEVGDSTPIQYTSFEFADHLNPDCMRAIDFFSDYATSASRGFRDESWLISDQETYDAFGLMVEDARQWWESVSVAQSFDCDTLVLPEVDFTQYSLLFVLLQSGCKPQEQKIEIVRCDASQTYEVLIDWPSKGKCAILREEQVFLLIPRLLPDYTLEIQNETL